MADPVFVVSNLTYTTGDGRALDVVPVRVVGGTVALNAVGQPVDTVAVQIAGGDPAILPSAITVAAGAPIGTVAARLFTTVSGAALSVVSGPFTLNGSNDLILSQAAGASGTTQTARIKAERASPFYSVTQDIVVTAFSALAISGTPGAAYVGSSYTFTPTVIGGSGTRAYSVSAGSLPAGLSLNPSTGAITGTPTTVASASFTVQVSDPTGSAQLATSISVTIPVPTNQQLISNFTGIPNASQVTMTATYTSNQGRNGHKMGRVGARDIRIRDDAIRIQNGAGTEASLPTTSTTYERALERSVGGTTRALYGGANSAVLAAGESITTDVIATRLEADEVFWTRFMRTVATPSTDALSAMDRIAPNQQGFRTSGASQLTGTGALNASGTGGGPSFMPTAVTGIPDSPLAAVVLVTDSIGNGSNDTNTDTTGGFLNRALLNVDGHAVPLTRQTTVGATLSSQMAAAAPKTKLIWPLVTDVFIHLGTNDLGALSTGTAAERCATLQTRFTDIATKARTTTGPYGKRLRVHASSIIRRGTFDATQEAARVLYNDWLAAGAGGLVDRYYDIVTAAGDPATYSDNIHPNPTDHAAMAAVVAAGFVPFLDPFYGV